MDNHFGAPGGLELLPAPVVRRLPLLITGGSQQTPGWIARHGDGWMIYPRQPDLQARVVADYRGRVAAHSGHGRPVMQPLYVDLLADASAPASPLHLGLRSGVKALRAHLLALQEAGINHVALNLRFNQLDVERTLDRLAAELLPAFA